MTDEEKNAYLDDDTNVYEDMADTGNNPAEKVISTMAIVLLVIGFLVSIIGFVAATVNENFFLGLLVLVLGGLYTVIVWAALMITVNISVNIRSIKQMLAYKFGTDK